MAEQLIDNPINWIEEAITREYFKYYEYKHFSNDLKFSKREKLIRSLAWQQAIKAGKQLTEKEMEVLVNDLFQCKQPNVSPNGNPTYLEFKKEHLEKMFGG